MGQWTFSQWNLCAFVIHHANHKVITCVVDGWSSGGICLFVQPFNEKFKVRAHKKLILGPFRHLRLLKQPEKRKAEASEEEVDESVKE